MDYCDCRARSALSLLSRTSGESPCRARKGKPRSRKIQRLSSYCAQHARWNCYLRGDHHLAAHGLACRVGRCGARPMRRIEYDPAVHWRSKVRKEGLRVSGSRCAGSDCRGIDCWPSVYHLAYGGDGVPEPNSRIVPLHRGLPPASRCLAAPASSGHTMRRSRRLSLDLVAHNCAWRTCMSQLDAHDRQDCVSLRLTLKSSSTHRAFYDGIPRSAHSYRRTQLREQLGVERLLTWLWWHLHRNDLHSLNADGRVKDRRMCPPKLAEQLRFAHARCSM
jgi:hypothetical protein